MNTLHRMAVVGAGLALSLLVLAAPARAQQDAGAKIRGDIYWPHQAASRRIETARNTAQDFQRYLAANPKPDAAVTKEATAEIGRNLEEAKKHLATMKKDFAADKAAVAAIGDIEKELTSAFEHHKLLCDCCEGKTFDAIQTMKCCTDLSKQLDKIHGQHADLMKKLAPKAAAPVEKKK